MRDPRQTVKVTDIEHATILAALRYWQRAGRCGEDHTTEPEGDIATNGGTIEPLTADEIDAFCERINV